MSSLAPTLEAFFTERLYRQLHASAHTIRTYRDTFRLLLDFAQQQDRQAALPARPRRSRRLTHRRLLGPTSNTTGTTAVRTRNARLAAIRSLFRYASSAHRHAAVIQRVLAIPEKRAARSVVLLSTGEIDALVAAPDRTTWTAGATTRYSSPLSRPGYACPNSSGSARTTSCSASVRTCAARAKDASNDAPRSPATPSPSYEPGWPSSPAPVTTRCSRPGEAPH